ncbi:phosphocholine cytidylyltransferase family protein [Parasphingorhabdus sp. JC815]|uniref:phosphocholine cytidylyltransferase family protein n=1 Tax=Parasphingorhabdus sp. JC815 TaxID=3232140 RepID=UPI00345B0147
MTERAIILNAGKGSRLLPLTSERPKCLIEFRGKAILDHQIEALLPLDLDEIIIVTGYRGEMITDHIANNVSRYGEKIRTIANPDWAESSSIASVMAARDYLSSNYMVMNGDTVYDAAILKKAAGMAKPGTSLLVEPLAENTEDDMLVKVQDGRVMAAAKTLSREAATHRSLGVIFGRSDGGAYRRMLDEVMACSNGHLQYHHEIINRLAGLQKVHAIESHSGTWQEIDRPEDLVE